MRYVRIAFFPQEKTGDFLDCFIPNPGCDDVRMFYWLGVLMGGVLRSDESLTLALPPFVWKLLVGEHVTWAKDYVAIDEAAVHITGEEIYVIHQPGGPYWEKLCPTSWIPPEAVGRGQYPRQRAQFFPIRTDLVLVNNIFIFF